MTTLTNNAEGGTNTSTVTTGNSGGTSGTAWDTVTIGTNTTNVYDSSIAMHGLSYKIVTGATSAMSYVRWGAALTTAFGGSMSTAYGRFYINLQSLPGTTKNYVGLHDSGVTVDRATFAVLTTGAIRLRNSAGSTVATFSTLCSTNTWYRVEFKIDGSSSGTYEIRLYAGDSGTLLETAMTGSSVNFGGTIGAITYGYFNSGSSLPQVNFDDLGLSDTGFMGAATSTFAGAAALTAASSLTAGAVETAVAAGALATASALTTAGLQTAVAAAPLTAASSLTSGAVETAVATIAMTAASGLSAGSTMATTGAAALTALSGLTTGATTILATSELVETFSAPLDAGIWTVTDGTGVTGAVNSDRYEITIGASVAAYSYLRTTEQWRLTSSSVLARRADAGTQSIATLEVYPIAVEIDASNRLFFYISGGFIGVYQIVAGTQTGLTFLAYDPAVHVWFRISEAAGTVTFDTSTDGSSWTVATSTTTPFSTDAIKVVLQAGEYGGGPGDATVIAFDDVNHLPASATATLTAASALTAAGSVTAVAAVAMTAVSDLSSGAIPTRPGTVALTAASGLDSDGVATLLGVAALSGSSNLVAGADTTAVAAVVLSASSALSADAAMTAVGADVLSAVSELVAGGTVTAVAAADLSAASSLTSGPIVTTAGTITMTAASSLAASANPNAVSTVALAATSDLTVDTLGSVSATATLSAVTDLGSAATRTATGAVALTAVSEFAAGGTQTAVGAATLSGASGLSIAAVLDRYGAVALTCDSSFTATGIRTALGSVALTGLSDLSATCTTSTPGTVIPARRITSFQSRPRLTASAIRARLVAAGNDP